MAVEGAAAASVLRLLERRVDDLSAEVTAQVSSAVASLQEKESELMRLLHTQQEELGRMRQQQQRLQEQLAGRPEAEQVSASALEQQMRHLVAELRNLQQEQILQQDPEVTGRARSQQGHVVDDVSLLKELREERALVAEMLENVKREKCEVIATMHTFATSKTEAVEELEATRRSACDEVHATAAAARKVLGRTMPPEAAAACRALREGGDELCRGFASVSLSDRDVIHTEVTAVTHPMVMHGRQGSRASLCPAGAHQAPGQTLAATTHQPAGVPIVAAPSVATGVTMDQCRVLTAQMMQGPDRRHSTGADPSLRRACSPARPANCSPTRQYSNGAAPGLLPVSVACSPPMLPRPTTLANDPQKSPVRRFISAGLSPRVQDSVGPGPSPGPGWAAMTQAGIMR